MVFEKQLAFAQAWMAVFTESVRSQQELALPLLTGATLRQHQQRARAAAERQAHRLRC